MNAKTIATIVFGLILIAAGTIYYFMKPAARPAKVNINQMKNMKITSPAFENNANIPLKYTCEGVSVSPPLAIGGVPASAKSLSSYPPRSRRFERRRFHALGDLQF